MLRKDANIWCYISLKHARPKADSNCAVSHLGKKVGANELLKGYLGTVTQTYCTFEAT